VQRLSSTRGILVDGGVFLGNLIAVPLIRKGKTVGDGLVIGCMAFFLVAIVYAVIAAVQGRDTTSNRSAPTSPGREQTNKDKRGGAE
jgi:hypothetical protein